MSSSVETGFAGFDAAAVRLLDDLPGYAAEQYAEQKALLRDGLSRPGGELIAALADHLDADLTVVARSSVSPLHRDLRFAPDGAARYKDHLLLTTWEGADKRAAPTLWVRLDAGRVGFASGIAFTPDIRERWRDAVGGAPGGDLADELARLVTERSAEVAGDQIKNVPAPFDADHPRADLLRHTGFQVRFAEPLGAGADVGGAGFTDRCLERLDALLPVHRWLLSNLID